MEKETLTPTEERALNVLGQLANWCNKFSGGTSPVPSLTIYPSSSSLSIGEVLVWDSEIGYADEMNDDYDDDPTFTRCVKCYKNQMQGLSAWPE